MALSKAHKQIIERAHLDKEFRVELLKELLRIAVAQDTELLDKAVAKIEAKKKK